MKKRFNIGLLLALGILGLLSGCGRDSSDQTEGNSRSEEGPKSRTAEETTIEENEKGSRDENAVRVTPTFEITELETGLSMVRYEGEYGFDTFLEFVGTYFWWGGLTAVVAFARRKKRTESFQKMNRISGAVLSLFGILVFIRAIPR